jgi:hypothetical protein
MIPPPKFFPEQRTWRTLPPADPVDPRPSLPYTRAAAPLSNHAKVMETLPVPEDIQLIRDFVDYGGLLRGDEKGEAQAFCDRLFRAFGHWGYKEAGATLEYRIKRHSTRGTSFADLVWKPRVLLEMKRRGENLYLRYNRPSTIGYMRSRIGLTT